MNRFRKSEQGFTLVELLIVVAIIGILAAIAIPQYAKYKRNAAISNCQGSIKNCLSDLAARYSEDSKVIALNCTLDGNKDGIKANIIGASGDFADIQTGVLDGVSGFKIEGNYTASNSTIECNAWTN